MTLTSPVKSCTLDPVPTFLLREFIDLLLPYVTTMVNASLSQGRFPSSQKHAVITLLLKKAGLDTADMGNYRPVSNLPFMSKVVERLAAAHLAFVTGRTHQVAFNGQLSLSNQFCMECHRAPVWGLCSSPCTRPNSVKWSPSID